MSDFTSGDLASLIDEVQLADELLAKQVRVEDGYIIINVGYDYEIAITSCNTGPKLLGWIIQLLEKTWMTNEILERFIRVAASQSNIEIQY